MKLSTTHDPMHRDALEQGYHLVVQEADQWHRSYQIACMALAVSVIINIVAIFWR